MSMNEPVHANQCDCRAMKFNAGAASRLRTLHPGRKAHLRQTEHPNALPASWHCPGQPKGVVGSSSLSMPGSLSVMDATDQLCRKDQYGKPAVAGKSNRIVRARLMTVGVLDYLDNEILVGLAG